MLAAHRPPARPFRSATRRLARTLAAVALSLPMSGLAAQQPTRAEAETLFVYGPGGPLPAMQEAAAAFGRARGLTVQVTGGPTPQWLDKARRDADVIFSGSEHMMTDFVGQLREAPAGAIVDSTILPLYLRPAAILVRKGNPRRIRRFEDLLRPGVKVLVVQGAGQTGMWEDVAGRSGDIDVVRAFRRNIAAFAPNSGEAKRRWTDDRSFDAWLIWNIWQVANPELADVVPLAPQWLVYRDCGVALTRRGVDRSVARAFVAHLRSAEGARVFARWGWRTRA
ncbi:MAG TPA: substrate-binding domain-containing protein [Gemmatimonadaceae bacterium]|nr:substrate-binding domain-containing protein [Gemmatimonadaceae bacterium]